MNANIITVTIEEDDEVTLSERMDEAMEWLADAVEDGATTLCATLVNAEARIEVFATQITKAAPKIRKAAKAKAEARMAARLAKYN